MDELIKDRLKWLQNKIDNPSLKEETYKKKLQEYLRVHNPELYKQDIIKPSN